MDGGWGVKRYKVIRLIGAGGMGELYEVWDTRLERRVAVKRLHPHLMARPDSEALVLREARAAAKVEHQNVVRIYGVEQAGEELLIEMEFIEGRPLNSLFYSGPLPAPLAVIRVMKLIAATQRIRPPRMALNSKRTRLPDLMP